MTLIFNRITEKEKRRSLRRKMPKAELMLWSRLKEKQLLGYKFRRQYGVGKYVVDFYCPKVMLVIEIDGPSHFVGQNKIHDEKRQKYIESFGIEFLRVTNSDIYNDIDDVLREIRNLIITLR